MSRPAGGATALVLRLRESAVAVALVSVAFSQSPGLLVADTKLDLVLDPMRFLARALLAWDDTAAFGQLQNQAYGYLFPMGPFFLAGHAIGLPGWVVQRLWWSLLLVLAFAGVMRLSRLLGVGNHTSRLVAATAYALSPRVLTTLGSISIESWPLALAPWVLVPLVRGAREGSARRAAMASALVVAAVGGVNAAATLAVLPLPVLFLLTRERGPRRRALLGWWAVGALLATAWWYLPLLVLGRYAFPFLDYIETAKVTTSVTSLTDALRGTSHWLAFVPHLGGPLWTAGWWLASATAAVLATTAVAAVGLVGLTHRRMPERRFLLLVLLLGVGLVVVGHAGDVASPVSAQVRHMLDGPLAPFRNVHKADLLIRLPLTLGLCHLLAVLPGWLRSWRKRVPEETARRLSLPSGQVLVAGAMTLVLLPLAGATWPAFRGDLGARGAFAQVPAYWTEASHWLDERPHGRTLLVPGSAFGEYTWGRPVDDPLQAYADQPWAVRNAVPLGAPGATRLLDGIGAELAAGRPSPGLAAALARAGVGRVLLRNDIDPLATPDPAAATRATLAGSPGLRRVASFGPWSGSTLGFEDPVVGPGPQVRALEVFDVAGSARGVVAVPRSGVSVLSGAAEATVGSVGLLGDTGRSALVTRSDAAGLRDRRLPWLVTDTQRRRALDFGAAVGAGYSQTLPRTSDPAAGRPAGDVLTDDDPAHQTTVRYDGAAAVTASSSAADPSAAGWRGPAARPYSALDGDAGTSWVSSATSGEQWLEVRWAAPRRLGRVTVRPGHDPGIRPVDAVRVTTDGGTVDGRLAGDTFEAQPPPGRTRRLRVAVPRQTAGRPEPVALAEVSAPGLRVREQVMLPAAQVPPSGTGWLLRRTPERRACIRPERAWLCATSLARHGEDGTTWRRTLTADRDQQMTAGALARARPGPALNRLLDRAAGYRASASSVLVDDPAARPGAAFDGDLQTGWVSGARDLAPTLTLTLPRPRTISRLVVLAQPDTQRRIRSVVVDAGGVRHEVRVGARRVPTFPAVTAARFRFTFFQNADAGGLDGRPLRIEEVFLPELPVPRREAVVQVPCADGPRLRVGDTVVRFSAAASTSRLLDGSALPARRCGGPLVVPRGETELVASPGAAVGLDTVALAPTGRPQSAAGRSRHVVVLGWGSEHRNVRVASGGPAVLALTEGFNAGWRARTSDGVTLRPVRVDGWRQAWLLPAGRATDVRLDFTPGGWHRAGLALGALGLLAVVALAAVRPVTSKAAAAPLAARPGGLVEVLLLAVGMPVLLGGAWGLAAGVTALWVRRALPERAVAGLLGLAALACGPAVVVSGTPVGGAAAQLCALLALALAASSLSAVPGRGPLVRRAVDRGDLPGEAAQQRLLQQQP